jgi:hypothetical protein
LRGRHGIRICNIGPGPLSPRAGRPGRVHNLVREPGHKYLPRLCWVSFGQLKFSGAVWRGFEYIFQK